MSTKPKDPLLAIAKIMVVIAQFLAIFAIVMLGIGIGALLSVGRADLMAEIATAEVPMISFWFIILAMLTGMGLMFLGYRFFGELLGIINSVGEGDPFHPENAARLSRMGWITVIVQAMILPVAGLAMWLAPYADKVDKKIQFDGGLDGGGILLTLILFILARVFREGTRMREELEGTV